VVLGTLGAFQLLDMQESSCSELKYVCIFVSFKMINQANSIRYPENIPLQDTSNLSVVHSEEMAMEGS
jgi:hypothetical protein